MGGLTKSLADRVIGAIDSFKVLSVTLPEDPRMSSNEDLYLVFTVALLDCCALRSKLKSGSYRDLDHEENYQDYLA